MGTELVSIIMAAYNAEKTISAAIDSVLSQTYPRFELLILNDGSTDGTAAIAGDYAARDSRIRLINSPTNRGASQMRLHGAVVAAGHWLAVLDSDDVWAPEKLEKQLALREKTGALFLFTGSSFMDFSGTPIPWQLHVASSVDYSHLLKRNIISNSSVLIRKDLYLTHYAAGDTMHEDFATWLKILRTGVIAYGIDEPLLCYRLSPTSKSGNKLRAAKMNWNTYRYIGLSPISAAYYMVWYGINGLRKYRHLAKLTSHHPT